MQGMSYNPKTPILSQQDNPHADYGMAGPASSQDLVKETKLKTSMDTGKETSKINVKKKQPGFLEREILVVNPDEINKEGLLSTMHERFTESFKKWRKKAQMFKLANLAVTVAVILVQLAQVIVFQFPSLSLEYKNALATILPAITGAILAIQLKLGWSEKGAKCKKSAKMFSVLASHTDYRMRMRESGGDLSDIDVVKLWNTALISESRDIPSFLLPY